MQNWMSRARDERVPMPGDAAWHLARDTRRRARGVAAVITLVAGLGSAVPAYATTAVAPASSTTKQASVRPSDDLLVKGVGDPDGYHLFVADAVRPSQWISLATINAAPQIDDSWIGRQCVTGDGRSLAVTVAPRAAASRPNGMAHGAYAYTVDVATGLVRGLFSGVTLAYFSPACGANSDVIFTTYGTADDSPTTLIKVDAVSGQRTQTLDLPGEVTSPTPLTDGSLVAVEGSSLIQITLAGVKRALVPISGRAFDVHPNQAGGVDFLVADGSQTATVERWSPSAGSLALGRGPLESVRLFAGRNGGTAVVGATPETIAGGAGLHWVHADAPSTVAALSLDLDAQLIERGATTGVVTPGRSAATPAIVQLPPARRATLSSASMPAATPSTGVPNQSSPTCAVPRNDVHRQIAQPSYAQVDWAVQLATRSALTAGRTGDPSWSLSAYYPSSDFPLGGVIVPREVLGGIIAAESNWQQASWHAIWA